MRLHIRFCCAFWLCVFSTASPLKVDGTLIRIQTDFQGPKTPKNQFKAAQAVEGRTIEQRILDTNAGRQ